MKKIVIMLTMLVGLVAGAFAAPSEELKKDMADKYELIYLKTEDHGKYTWDKYYSIGHKNERYYSTMSLFDFLDVLNEAGYTVYLKGILEGNFLKKYDYILTVDFGVENELWYFENGNTYIFKIINK